MIGNWGRKEDELNKKLFVLKDLVETVKKEIERERMKERKEKVDKLKGFNRKKRIKKNQESRIKRKAK